MYQLHFFLPHLEAGMATFIPQLLLIPSGLCFQKVTVTWYKDQDLVRASPPRRLSDTNSLLSIDTLLEYSGRLILNHIG